MINHALQQEQDKATQITFSDWLKNLVFTKAHSGICQCQRQFGTINKTDFTTRLLNPKVHCPSCGSGWLMGHRGSKGYIPVGDYIVVAAGKVCRMCSLTFSEYDVFTSCKADPPPALAKYQEKVRKADEAAKSVGIPGGIEEFREKMLALSQQREEARFKENSEAAAKPGTPEWYAEHPEES